MKYFVFAFTFWISCLLPLATQATSHCTELFEQNAHARFSDEITNFNNRFWHLNIRSESNREVTTWYQKKLQSFIDSASTIEELIEVLFTINSLGVVSNSYQDAWRSVDFLSLLRSKSPNTFDTTLKENLHNLLETLVHGSILRWSPVLDAYYIWEDDSHADIVVNDWIYNKQALRDSYLYTGEDINMTLVQSLAHLPRQQQDVLILRLQEAMTLKQTPDFKDSSREFQFAQLMLIRNDFLQVVSNLPSSVRIEDLSQLENVLQRLHRHNKPYSFALVFEVAGIIHTNMGSLLEKEEDFIEIYGSFPNLGADLNTSDVDIIFSQRLDQLYYDLISQIVDTESKEFINRPDYVRFVQSIVDTENRIRERFRSQQNLWQLVSIKFLGRDDINAEFVITENRDQSQAWHSMISPLMIRVYKDRIVLRVWDGFALGLNNFCRDYSLLL